MGALRKPHSLVRSRRRGHLYQPEHKAIVANVVSLNSVEVETGEGMIVDVWVGHQIFSPLQIRIIVYSSVGTTWIQVLLFSLISAHLDTRTDFTCRTTLFQFCMRVDDSVGYRRCIEGTQTKHFDIYGLKMWPIIKGSLNTQQRKPLSVITFTLLPCLTISGNNRLHASSNWKNYSLVCCQPINSSTWWGGTGERVHK